jgi:hypothetical protein
LTHITRTKNVARRTAAVPYHFLIPLLVAAAVLRVAGIDFGLPGKFRPDEEFLVSRGLGILGGELNPHFFQYPSLYMYLLAGVYGTWRAIGGLLGAFGAAGFQAYIDAHAEAPAYLVARLTSAALGVAQVAATYRLGRLAVSARVGVLAAGLLTFGYAHVRESHFATTDVAMVLWATLALAAMIAVTRDGRMADSLQAGALAGLAFSTKYPALALSVPLALAHMIPWRPGALRRASAAGLVMASVFVATSPYVFLDFTSFRAAMAMESGFLGGLPGLDAPHGLPWLVGFAMRYGLGLPVALVALVGLGWAVRDAVRGGRFRPAALLLLAFTISVATPFVLTRITYVRYALPIFPVLAVLAARVVMAVGERATPKHAWPAACGLAALLSLEPAQRALRTDRLLAQPDTRSLARDFVVGHLPPGARIGANTYYAYPKPQLPPDYRLVDFAGPDGPDAEWVLLEEHPISFFSPPAPPAAAARLASFGEVVADFDPFVPGRREEGVYDPADAFYVPLAGQDTVTRPGPRIRIYHLRPAR